MQRCEPRASARADSDFRFQRSHEGARVATAIPVGRRRTGRGRPGTWPAVLPTSCNPAWLCDKGPPLVPGSRLRSRHRQC